MPSAGRKLPRLHVLLIALLLAGVAQWLPGGLFPQRQVAAARASKTSRLAGFFAAETEHTVAADAEFLVDAAGRLLLPVCASGPDPWVQRPGADPPTAMLRVRCVGTGRAVVHLSAPASNRTNQTLAVPRTVGLADAAADAAEGARVGLLCGHESQEARVVPRCLPIIARVMRELAPRAYDVHVRAAWENATRAGVPVCCNAAEERKPLELVDVSRCGVKCPEPPARAGRVVEIVLPDDAATA